MLDLALLGMLDLALLSNNRVARLLLFAGTCKMLTN